MSLLTGFSLLLLMLGMVPVAILVNLHPRREKYYIYIYRYAAFVFACFIIAIVASHLRYKGIRSTIKNTLESKKNQITTIYINGKSVKMSQKILDTIGNTKYVLGNHSTTKMGQDIHIVIKYPNDILYVTLKQDSKKDYEYWVYTDYFKDAGTYEYIGRTHVKNLSKIIKTLELKEPSDNNNP